MRWRSRRGVKCKHGGNVFGTFLAGRATLVKHLASTDCREDQDV
jgi:hypothetical protein